MDDIVKAALLKWPQVPHCHGWLALDARGNWFLRDEDAQAAGPFPQIKGSRIEHEKLIGFIHRNYANDDAGAWFFQNGPQRVYVELEAAPFVFRVDAAPGWPVHAHTGEPASVESAWLDESGRLYLDTTIGYGIVHTLDMEIASRAVEAGHWQPSQTTFAAMPAQFGYTLHPQPAARQG